MEAALALASDFDATNDNCVEKVYLTVRRKKYIHSSKILLLHMTTILGYSS